MEHQEYEDLDVLLEQSEGGFSARVTASPDGVSPPVAFVPPGEDELVALVAEMRRVRGLTDARTGRRVAPTTSVEPPVAATSSTGPMTPRQFGTRLFNAVFVDSTLSVLRHSLRALDDDKGLRLRLMFGEGAQLTNLPWEYLYDPARHAFPCQFRDSPTVRVVELPNSVRAVPVEGALRMLVVVSGPTDLPLLDIEREWDLLYEAVAPLVERARLEVVRCPSSQLNALWAAASIDKDFHIFHFIGHGGFDPESGEGQLAFTDENGRAQLVGAGRLRVVLSNSRFRLAVLNSCEGGRTTAADPYASTAISLVQQGIPAVVAMQFEISDVAAIDFSRELYGRLAAGRSIEESMTLARQAILTRSESEWATPVLYLRNLGGPLFAELNPAADAAVPLPPKGPPVEPAMPVALSATQRDDDVALKWEQPAVAGVSVDRWAVVRNGEPHASVHQPHFVDEGVEVGRYEYVVVAGSADGEMSDPSEPWVVTVSPRVPPPPVHVGRWLMAGVAVIVLVLAVWLLTRPGPALAAPSNLQLELVGRDVTLTWEQPEGGEVAEWVVLRDGKEITRVTSPRYEDEDVPAGSHVYTVVAVGKDPNVSATSVPTTLGTTPPTTTTTTTTITTTTSPPLPAAPTNVDAVQHVNTVKVTWNQPQVAKVDYWRILRDGNEIGQSEDRSYTDAEVSPGTHTYAVVAVGKDGLASKRSEPDEVVFASVPVADLAVTRNSVSGAANKEWKVAFDVRNEGPDPVVDGRFEISAPDGLTEVSYSAGSGDQPCKRSGREATCSPVSIEAGATRPIQIIVFGTFAPNSGPVVVTVSSSSHDSDPSDNTASGGGLWGGSLVPKPTAPLSTVFK